MSNINVKVGQPDIKVRVGQQNSVKIISSVSGSAGGKAFQAENVIGGIASVTQLSVSGISTFVGVATFINDVYIDGNLYYGTYNNGGVAYFNSNGLMVSTGSTSSAIDYSNYILSTNNSGVPSWSSVIDGGSY